MQSVPQSSDTGRHLKTAIPKSSTPSMQLTQRSTIPSRVNGSADARPSPRNVAGIRPIGTSPSNGSAEAETCGSANASSPMTALPLTRSRSWNSPASTYSTSRSTSPTPLRRRSGDCLSPSFDQKVLECVASGRDRGATAVATSYSHGRRSPARHGTDRRDSEQQENGCGPQMSSEPRESSVENPRNPALAFLNDPVVNRGIAFGEAQRSELGLRGLLPSAIGDIDQQVTLAYTEFGDEP